VLINESFPLKKSQLKPASNKTKVVKGIILDIEGTVFILKFSACRIDTIEHQRNSTKNNQLNVNAGVRKPPQSTLLFLGLFS